MRITSLEKETLTKRYCLCYGSIFVLGWIKLSCLTWYIQHIKVVF